MRWFVLVAVLSFACSRKPDADRTKAAGSAAGPPHVASATPTILTMSVHDFLTQATAGGSAWSLRHVRVHGQIDAITRDASGCITDVTLRDGTDTVRCTLVDPSPIPLHATTTVDAQSSIETSPPSLAHCRVLAPPGGGSAALEPACTDASHPTNGSAAK